MLAATIDNAWQRVGTRSTTTDENTIRLTPVGAAWRSPDAGVLVYWPRNGWLSVEPTGTAVAAPFQSGADRLRAVVTQFKGHTHDSGRRVCTPEWLARYDFRVGTVNLTAGAGMKLTLTADTNAKAFCREGRAALANGTPLTVSVQVWFFNFTTAPEDVHVATLAVTVDPAAPAARSPRFLALDLGNCNSTAAALAAGEDRVDQIEMVGVGLSAETRTLTGWASRGGVRATPSDVRIDQVRTAGTVGDPLPARIRFPDDARPEDFTLDTIDYHVGDVARVRRPGSTPRSLVVGGKRLAANRTAGTVTVVTTHRHIPRTADGKAQDPIVSAGREVLLDLRTPLNLLATKLLHNFREAYKAWPAALAVTYPTTYSRYELRALRQAVHRGWLRFQNWRSDQPTASGDTELAALAAHVASSAGRAAGADDDRDGDQLIKLLIDEATAASFFHLYRRIFADDAPGGLVGFHYQHEDGLNLLLCDCGGGTTDIALVHAKVDGDNQDVLRLKVLGRSGVRSFGGDNITRELARLLKAKICFEIGKARNLPGFSGLKLPDKADLAGVRKFIDQVAAADKDDLILATRLRGDWTDDQRRRALDLWQLAEDVKIKFDETETIGLPAVKNAGGMDELTWVRGTNALAAKLLPDDAAAANVVKAQLLKVKVHRWELDALVSADIDRVVANCNGLIRARLRPGADPDIADPAVHWVVASGSAVKYALVRRRLEEGLDVPLLGDGGFTFDPENAKDATAKGAVLALATQEANGRIKVEFQGDLVNRLPFDVGFWDYTVNRPSLLYAEYTHYDDLRDAARQRIQMAPGRPGDPPAKLFKLVRRFPGDEGFSDFLRFDFPDGIHGDLSIRYDAESPFEFEVTDASGTVGLPSDPTDQSVYVPPALRGDI